MKPEAHELLEFGAGEEGPEAVHRGVRHHLAERLEDPKQEGGGDHPAGQLPDNPEKVPHQGGGDGLGSSQG